MSDAHRESVPPLPPEAWPRAHRAMRLVARPLERFLAIEAASGILLVVAAAVALAWANSPWRAGYRALWHLPVVVGVGSFQLQASLHFVVNDILMVGFFFVVGLEIRRELHGGELSELRRAALPVVAAIGGMVVPAALFLAINRGGAGVDGWAVPMATDIAFAVGVLALLGRRVPSALRVLLLALAIIDDIGAILIIALFFSDGVALLGIAVAAGGIATTIIMQRSGARRPVVYLVPGVVVWVGAVLAGIHPTVAGVALGLLTPAVPWFGPRGFAGVTRKRLAEIEATGADPAARSQDLAPAFEAIAQANREARSPVDRLESLLHPWVAFAVMPIFALANAGVDLSGVELGRAVGLTAGIGIGLVVGKPLGILVAVAVAVRLGLVRLPAGVTRGGVAVVAAVAGIGFTMSLFIADLAFAHDPAMLGAAKLAVLLASTVAAAAALALGMVVLRSVEHPGAAATVDEAERRTET